MGDGKILLVDDDRDLLSSLRDLLERCLRKDPRKRVPDIAVARIALQEMGHASEDGPHEPATPAERRT